MKRSVKKILTTHTGSLPRPAGLLSLLSAKEAGTLTNRADFDIAVRDAVADFGAGRNLLASRRLVDFTHAVCY